MSEETKKHVQVTHIKNGEIKREQASLKTAIFVKATLSSVNKETEHRSSMKEELFQALAKQRIKIEEETKRAEASKDAWVKHLEKQKHKTTTQEEGSYETKTTDDDHVDMHDDYEWMHKDKESKL